MAHMVQRVGETPLEGGDVFVDADGVIWTALYNPKGAPTKAALTWHTKKASTSREGEEWADLDEIREPYRLVVRLSEVSR